MQTFAKLRYVRIAPRKVRLVTRVVRGKTAKEAGTLLRFMPQKSAKTVLKVLQGAIASAQSNHESKEENLYISKITVDEGPKYKRFRPRARGRAFPIQKKTSHVTLVLDEIEGKAASAQDADVVAKDSATLKTDKTKTRARQQHRAEREIKKTTGTTGAKRLFRRKAI